MGRLSYKAVFLRLFSSVAAHFSMNLTNFRSSFTKERANAFRCDKKRRISKAEAFFPRANNKIDSMRNCPVWKSLSYTILSVNSFLVAARTEVHLTLEQQMSKIFSGTGVVLSESNINTGTWCCIGWSQCRMLSYCFIILCFDSWVVRLGCVVICSLRIA